MSYEVALNKAWQELENISKTDKSELKFLNDIYEIDVKRRQVLSVSCNIAAKEYLTVLILHYELKKFGGILEPTGNWISFKDVPGGEIYYPAFRKQAIEPLLRKYGANPQGILLNRERLNAQEVKEATAAISLEVFERVPVLVKIWPGDEEFPVEADMLFDKSITEIFCTEDITVLAGVVASTL